MTGNPEHTKVFASVSEPTGQAFSAEEFLQEAARVLATLGMRVQPYERGGELREIEVDHPRDPSHGHAVLDREGFLTWEGWCRTTTSYDAQAAAQTITTLLSEHSPALTDCPRPPAVTSRPPAPEIPQ